MWDPQLRCKCCRDTLFIFYGIIFFRDYILGKCVIFTDDKRKTKVDCSKYWYFLVDNFLLFLMSKMRSLHISNETVKHHSYLLARNFVLHTSHSISSLSDSSEYSSHIFFQCLSSTVCWTFLLTKSSNLIL